MKRIYWIVGFLAGFLLFGSNGAEAGIFKIQLTSADSSMPTNLRVNDNRTAVYIDTRDGDREVYLFDYVTMSETKITNNNTNERNVDIDDDGVVWSDQNQHLHYYDLTTRVVTDLPESISSVYVAVSQGRIAYNQDGYIKIYDMATEAVRTIDLGQYPDIDGNYVSYHRQYPTKTDNFQIHVFELSTNQVIWRSSDFDIHSRYHNYFARLKGNWVTWNSLSSLHVFSNYDFIHKTAGHQNLSANLDIPSDLQNKNSSGDGRLAYFSQNLATNSMDLFLARPGYPPLVLETNYPLYTVSSWDFASPWVEMVGGKVFYFKRATNGKYELWMQSQDLAGPESGSLTLNYGEAVTYAQTVNITDISCRDNDTYVTQMQLANEDDLWSDWMPAAGSFENWSLTKGPGNKTVKARFMDWNGNISGEFRTYIQVKQDGMAPLVSLAIDNGSDYLTAASASLKITALDNLTPAEDLEMRFSNDNVTWTNWEKYAKVKAWDIPPGDGEKTVFVQVKDLDQNVGTAWDSVNLSVSSPWNSETLFSGNLSGEAYYVKDNRITLMFENVGASSIRFMTTDTLWSDWEPVSDSRILYLPAGDGKKKVGFQLKNGLERVSPLYYMDFVLDSLAPSFVLRTANGAGATTNGSVSLEIADLTDNSEGGFQYSINGGTVVPLPADNRITVTGLPKGLQTVRVRLFDRADNWAEKSVQIWSL